MFESIPLYLLLAQTCVAEISFQKDPTECIVMWEINERAAKASKRTLKKQTLLYNSYWKSRKQRNARKWIMFLEHDEEPKHWPKGLRWKYHKHLWLKYVRAARTFLATRHKREPLCPHAVQYGGPQEYPRMYLERTVCVAGALQWYWAKSNFTVPTKYKGILPKKAVGDENIISESILTSKRKAANGAGD